MIYCIYRFSTRHLVDQKIFTAVPGNLRVRETFGRGYVSTKGLVRVPPLFFWQNKTLLYIF